MFCPNCGKEDKIMVVGGTTGRIQDLRCRHCSVRFIISNFSAVSPEARNSIKWSLSEITSDVVPNTEPVDLCFLESSDRYKAYRSTGDVGCPGFFYVEDSSESVQWQLEVIPSRVTPGKLVCSRPVGCLTHNYEPSMELEGDLFDAVKRALVEEEQKLLEGKFQS